jgi:hypothetical protein
VETIFLFLTIVACCICAWWSLSCAWFYTRHTPNWMNTEDRVSELLDSIQPGPLYAFLLSVLWLLARVCA